MQAMPHPETWFIEWAEEQHLLGSDVLQAYLIKRDEALLRHPPGDPNPPTLGGLLERDGLLTKEQRETGEAEAFRREREFVAWRSQALRDQQQFPPDA